MLELSSWREEHQRPLGWKEKCRGPEPGGSEVPGGSLGVRAPLCLLNLQTKIRSRAKSTCRTNCPEGSAAIMWAWVRSWPLKAKLPGGAIVGFRGPTVPAPDLISAGSPRRPPDRMGNTATEPPK